MHPLLYLRNTNVHHSQDESEVEKEACPPAEAKEKKDPCQIVSIPTLSLFTEAVLTLPQQINSSPLIKEAQPPPQ